MFCEYIKQLFKKTTVLKTKKKTRMDVIHLTLKKLKD